MVIRKDPFGKISGTSCTKREGFIQLKLIQKTRDFRVTSWRLYEIRKFTLNLIWL